MKNKLAYLGFLGFIGILGLYWHSFIHSIFLVFFFFFSYSKIIPDELFKENIKKSALKAFIINMVFNTVILTICTFISNRYQYVSPNNSMLIFAFAAFVLNFAVSILIFVFTLMIYAHRDRSVLE
jgi:cation transporter-like permease